MVVYTKIIVPAAGAAPYDNLDDAMDALIVAIGSSATAINFQMIKTGNNWSGVALVK